MYLGHILLPATQPAQVQEAAITGLGAFPSRQSRIPVPIPGMLPHITGSGSSVGPSARNVALGAFVSSRSSGTFKDSSLVARGLMTAQLALQQLPLLQEVLGPH